ncbi:dual specificity protein kinase CLK4-like isoform 3-T4 [Acanthopagrus schlegelii]
MGREDNKCASPGDDDQPKTDADRRTGSFNQSTLCTSAGSRSSAEDNSLLSGLSGDNAVSAEDDGAQRSQRGTSCEDDEDGHLVYHIGLLMKERYEVISTLGEGAFGKVVECIDRDKDERVAVKIVRNIDSFSEVARSEISVLQEINSLDDDNRFACVRMLDWFEHGGHVCIVFELLGISTFEFLLQNDFLSFSVEQIRHMAFQIFRAVCYLGWSQSCDVWSLGCVLMEFFLGRVLFMTHDSREHLAMMEKVLGPIPPHLLKKTSKKHYVHNERLNWDEQGSSGDYIRKHCKPLKQFMQRASEEERQLFDLLSCMLEYDVCRRITLEEALWHPFFSPERTHKHQRS